MWKGRLLEILGLGLIVSAFMNQGGSTVMLVNAVGGGLIALTGTVLWHDKPRLALITNVLGLFLIVAAFLPPLRIHAYNTWVAGCGGLVAWFVGWRVVASESGGPWRLSDRPTF